MFGNFSEEIQEYRSFLDPLSDEENEKIPEGSRLQKWKSIDEIDEESEEGNEFHFEANNLPNSSSSSFIPSSSFDKFKTMQNFHFRSKFDLGSSKKNFENESSSNSQSLPNSSLPLNNNKETTKHKDPNSNNNSSKSETIGHSSNSKKSKKKSKGANHHSTNNSTGKEEVKESFNISKEPNGKDKSTENSSDDGKLSLNDLLTKLRKNQDIEFENVKWSSTELDLLPITIFVQTFTGSLIQLQVSLEDNVQVIAQSLAEYPETCFITSYHFEIGGERLADFANLSEIPNLQPQTTFVMVHDPYNEKSSRIHVHRLREILSSNPYIIDERNPSLYSYFTLENKPTQQTIKSCGLPLLDTSLNSFYPPHQLQVKCLRSIIYSGWNPPPSQRALMGDLFYLEVETLEKKTFFITACSEGFYVNESTENVFSPRMNPKYSICHSLVDLLNNLSLSFKKGFELYLSTRLDHDSFELYPVLTPSKCWLGQNKPHSYDKNRLLDANYSTYFENDTFLRDWNEEFQSSRELPSSTVKERIIRDHALYRVNTDFVDAATKGACAIINKCVLPLNPMDPKPVQMYIYNNIFFSYAIDTENKYEEVEGRYTYASANNDLNGVMLYADCVNGLYSLATSIIDYKGIRMVAQSMIPGIFNPNTTVYTYADFEKEGTFKKLLDEASKVVCLQPHHENAKKLTIGCSTSVKGIVGTDGRHYIIDLCRVTPQDTNFKGKKQTMAILRPELMMILHDDNAPIFNDRPVQLNPDAFTPTYTGTDEQKQIDEAAVENASAILLQVLIPNMIQEFTSFVTVPVDGQTLTYLMHHRGINMRYLGFIASLTNSYPFLQDLCIKEMVVRTAKQILRAFLSETEDSQMAKAIATFLNCFLGAEPKSRRLTQKKKKKVPSSFKGNNFSFSSQSLWAVIFHQVKNRFQYEIPESFRSSFCVIPPSDMNKILEVTGHIPVLRNLCQKVGIQIACRDYDFTSETPFQPEDILDLFPVVKHLAPKNIDGYELLEAGVDCLSQGKLEHAFELLSEALVIFSQVNGPMHQSTAICFGNLAMVLYQSGDPAEAAIYQQKALIISERVQGLDHFETVQSYGNLALFYHKMGKLDLALTYIKRALYLGYLACGLLHPDNGTAFTNIGMILQDLGAIDSSLVYFLKALHCTESLVGYDHLLLTAAICHAIAIDYSLLERWKEALEYERKNYSILEKAISDEKDSRLQESSLLLKEYTQKAVEQAQNKKANLNNNSNSNSFSEPKEKFIDVSKDNNNLSQTPLPNTKSFSTTKLTESTIKSKSLRDKQKYV